MMFRDYCTTIGSGVDFDSNAITITINEMTGRGIGNILINCDKFVEGVETFDLNLTLARDNSLVRVGRDASEGRIIDSTGMVSVAVLTIVFLL